MHFKDFEKIKQWYDKGIYKKTHVRIMVEKSKITAEEYKEITGEDYSAEDIEKKIGTE